MNRPDKRNAIDQRMAGELSAAFDTFDADPVFRVAVLTGTSRVFSAGTDMKELGLAAGREVHPVRIRDPHRPVPDLKLHVPSHREKLAATGHTRTCSPAAARSRRVGPPDAGDGGLRSPSRCAYRLGTACAPAAGRRPTASPGSKRPSPGTAWPLPRPRSKPNGTVVAGLAPAMAVHAHRSAITTWSRTNSKGFRAVADARESSCCRENDSARASSTGSRAAPDDMRPGRPVSNLGECARQCRAGRGNRRRTRR